MNGRLIRKKFLIICRIADMSKNSFLQDQVWQCCCWCQIQKEGWYHRPTLIHRKIAMPKFFRNPQKQCRNPLRNFTCFIKICLTSLECVQMFLDEINSEICFEFTVCGNFSFLLNPRKYRNILGHSISHISHSTQKIKPLTIYIPTEQGISLERLFPFSSSHNNWQQTNQNLVAVHSGENCVLMLP